VKTSRVITAERRHVRADGLAVNYQAELAWTQPFGNEAQRLANARLIAAAPALYEALEAVTRSTEWSCMEAGIQSAVLAALAQARGEQP
jgi:hypothetical protein